MKVKPSSASAILTDCLARHLDGGRGGAVAIRSDSGTLTYAEIAGAVAYGAMEIADGLGGERRLLIASRNQLRVGIAFLGALAAGAVPLLADPTSPAVLRELALRFDARKLFGDELAEAADDETIFLSVVDHWIANAAEAREPRWPSVRADEEAFWVFTSGTTGSPKAVVHSHGAPPAAFDGFARQVLGLVETDVTISTAGLPFVYALGNNFLFPLMAGASCILPDDLLLPTVLSALGRFGATVLVAGPWSLEALARLAQRDDRAAALRRLRLVLSAGEPLPPEVFRAWKARFGLELIDNLGCTEMFNSFLSTVPGDACEGSLGRAVPGFEVEVGGAPPRPGARGALRVRGRSRALRIDGASPADPGDWCETGDEVSVDAEGRFIFLGRLDDRFKVKGQFVSPVEVERVIREVEGVVDCLVHPEIDARGLTRVAAKVVLAEGADPARIASRLRAHLRGRLKAVELPQRFEVVDALPRGARGKVERPGRRLAGVRSV